MSHRVPFYFFPAAGVAALLLLGPNATANAADGTDTRAFMKAVDSNADKTISLEELDSYARRRFAQIESDHDKTLSDKELKGRLSDAGMTEADTDKDKTVDEKEFVAYANKLFTEANVRKTPDGDHPTLSEQELDTAAGRKLMSMLR